MVNSMSNSNINNIHDLRMYSEHGTEMINDDYISRNTTFSSEKIANDMNNITNITDNIVSNMTNILKNHAGSTNPNILHNWDFTHPVHQINQKTYTTNGITIDRWTANLTNSGVVHVMDGFLRMERTNTATSMALRQRIEFPEKYIGKTVTMSLKTPDGIISGTLEIPSERGVSHPRVNINDKFNMHMNYSTGGILEFVIFTNAAQTGYSLDILAAKLELGSISTLANDPPMDFGKELATCQRYQMVVNGNLLARASVCFSTTIRFLIPAPVMRINPIIRLTLQDNILKLRNPTGAIITNPVFRFSAITTSIGLDVLATSHPTIHGITDATLDMQNVIFDANL